MGQWSHAGTPYFCHGYMIAFMFYNIYFLHACFICIYFANICAPFVFHVLSDNKNCCTKKRKENLEKHI